MKEEEFSPKVVKALVLNMNIPMKYCELCDAIGIPYKQGRTKEFQLRRLSNICELKILKKPTRYVIVQVFSSDVAKRFRNDKTVQKIFDYGIFSLLMENDSEPVILTKSGILQKLSIVNENYIFTRDTFGISLLNESYSLFPEITAIVQSILWQWVEAKIDNMVERNLYNIRKGFRLYTLTKVKDEVYRIPHDVEYNSDMHKECLEIKNEAFSKTFHSNIRTNKIVYTENLWNAYYRNLSTILSKHFHGRFQEIRDTYIFSFVEEIDTNDYKAKFLQAFSNDIDIDVLNKEAQDKIMKSKNKKFEKYFSDIPFYIEVAIALKPKRNLGKMIKDEKICRKLSRMFNKKKIVAPTYFTTLEEEDILDSRLSEEEYYNEHPDERPKGGYFTYKNHYYKEEDYEKIMMMEGQL